MAPLSSWSYRRAWLAHHRGDLAAAIRWRALGRQLRELERVAYPLGLAAAGFVAARSGAGWTEIIAFSG